MKICAKCKQEKENWQFDYCNNHSDGLRSRCKECRREYDQQNSEQRLKVYLWNEYGMTLVEYELMLKSQDGVCAICEQPETKRHQSGKIKRLSVDHDHKTSKIRGLLCDICNRGLGQFKDDPELLRKAADYLEHA